MNKDISSFSLACMLLGFAPLGYSLPFTIVPLGTLPTSVNAGSSVSATYTVTNNTDATRSNNFVKYLPPNVTQVTTGTGVCGATFTLAPHGQSGDSCTLSLTISGAVNASTPNPKDHLFVCFPKGMTCAGTNFPLNVSLISSVAPQVAGGIYRGSSAFFPMLATSLNGGAWTYPIDSTLSTLPLDYADNGTLSTVNCSDVMCIAAGLYSDTSFSYPLLTQSTNKAVTWTYHIEKNTNLPNQYLNNGEFFDTSCSGPLCMAGGTYVASDSTNYPMLAVTTGGTSWAYTIDASTGLPAGFVSDGSIRGVSCSGSLCLAGGYYRDATTKNFPSLAVSTDSGATWSYAIKASVNLPPSYNTAGRLYGVSCDGQVCTAVGGYGAGGGNRFPILAVSTNGASTWTYAIDNTPSTLPADYSNNGIFNSTSCSGSTCIAGGDYEHNGISFPMLSVSTNGGVSWTYKIDSSTLPLDYDNDGQFYSVFCSGQTCLAGGLYHDTTDTFPMLAVSTDAGQTWTYKIDKTPATLPADFSHFGGFSVVSCTGLVCTASGAYSDGMVQYPLLALSNDGGNTWAYQIDSNPTTLPAAFVDDGLFGLSSI